VQDVTGEHCEYPDFASSQLREDLFSGSFLPL